MRDTHPTVVVEIPSSADPGGHGLDVQTVQQHLSALASEDYTHVRFEADASFDAPGVIQSLETAHALGFQVELQAPPKGITRRYLRHLQRVDARILVDLRRLPAASWTDPSHGVRTRLQRAAGILRQHGLKLGLVVDVDEHTVAAVPQLADFVQSLGGDTLRLLTRYAHDLSPVGRARLVLLADVLRQSPEPLDVQLELASSQRVMQLLEAHTHAEGPLEGLISETFDQLHLDALGRLWPYSPLQDPRWCLATQADTCAASLQAWRQSGLAALAPLHTEACHQMVHRTHDFVSWSQLMKKAAYTLRRHEARRGAA
jgi:hypothetical protein